MKQTFNTLIKRKKQSIQVYYRGVKLSKLYIETKSDRCHSAEADVT